VTDVARASKFYNSVLGWESDASAEGRPSNMAGTKSVHFFSKGVLNGAFHLRDDAGVDASRPGAVVTFLVDSIDDTLAKAESAGGKSVVYAPLRSSKGCKRRCADEIPMFSSKTEIGGGMGFFGRFADSEGNIQGLFQKA